jgi:tetratricopeptide (TPR) repeat protein
MASAARNRAPERLLEIGEGFAAIGDSTRAAQYFSLAIEDGGDERQIFPRLLAMLVRDRQYRAAIFRAEYYLKKHPDDANVRFVTGSLYVGTGQAAEARGQYEAILQGGAERIRPEIYYALALLSRDVEGDVLAADVHFRDYLREAPNGKHAAEARASLLETVP